MIALALVVELVFAPMVLALVVVGIQALIQRRIDDLADQALVKVRV